MENKADDIVRIHIDMTLDRISIWQWRWLAVRLSHMHDRTDARGGKTLPLHQLNTSIYGGQTYRDLANNPIQNHWTKFTLEQNNDCFQCIIESLLFPWKNLWSFSKYCQIFLGQYYAAVVRSKDQSILQCISCNNCLQLNSSSITSWGFLASDLEQHLHCLVNVWYLTSSTWLIVQNTTLQIN